MFLAVVDQTIVVTALPAIAGAFGSAELISWVVVSYLIAATAAAPVYGRLGDQLGRRRLMLVALTIVMGGSLLCAASNSIEVLILARAVQGFGGGGLMTLSQALVGEAVPPRDRARYHGYLAAVAVTSSTLGPVAGSFLTQHFGWQAVFILNMPVAIVAVLLTLRLHHRPGAGIRGRFDFPGMLLFAAFAGSALSLLKFLPTLATTPLRSLTVLVMTVALASLLVRRERRADNPLFPLDLMRNPSIWRSDLLAACHGATLVSLLTFLPLYVRVIHDAPQGEIGTLLLPMTAGVGLGSMLTGRIVGTTGRTAAAPSIGLAVLTLCLAGLAVLSPGLSLSSLAWYLGFSGLFMGTVMAVVQVTVQVAAGPVLLGTAAATVQFSRSLGAAFGTAVVSAVLFSAIALGGPEMVDTFGLILRDGASAFDSVPFDERHAVVQTLVRAFRLAFFAICGFPAIAMLAAWSLPIRRI